MDGYIDGYDNYLDFGIRNVSPGSGTFVIAELGTSHGGDLKKAFELIEAAKEAGADCAKFQMVFADEIIHPKTGVVPLPGGDIPLFDRFRSLEQNLTFFAELKEFTEKSGMVFLCSPFGIKSASLLRELNVSVIKIASPELNHYPLLDEIAGYNIPVIVSSGVSLLGDIEKTLGKTGRNNTVLLHCVTSYPAPEEDYNIRLVGTLSRIFGVITGISDHSLNPVLVPALSVLEGGKVVEKHFTLSRSDSGLDDPIALTPREFSRMTEHIRRFEKLAVNPGGREEGIAQLKEEYGESRIEGILGDGIKKLAPSERANYTRTNRSLHALTDIEAGTELSPENVGILRTEKILSPGLSPEFYPVILGKKAGKKIVDGEGILWEHLW